MATHVRLLGVTNDAQMNWDRLSATRQQELLDFLNWYGWESTTELPSTFKQLMGAFEESKLADSPVPPLNDQLTAFLPVVLERTCAMFNVQGTPYAIIFEPDASSCRSMVASAEWQGIDSRVYFRLEAREREYDLIREADWDTMQQHFVRLTGEFLTAVMRPLLMWPPCRDNPEEALLQCRFHYHEVGEANQ